MERVAPAMASNRWSYRDRLDEPTRTSSKKTSKTKQTRRRSSRAVRVAAGDDEDDGAVDPCVRMSDSS